MRAFDNWNRYYDNDNNILHGCIQFNVKDGNTVADIYDSDGTSLTNPILTDIYGRTERQVFVNEDIIAYFYKYIGNGTWTTETDIDTSDNTKWSLQYTSENIMDIVVPSLEGLLSVNNISELRTISGEIATAIALLGYVEAGDKETIIYIWDDTSTATDDNGGVIQGSENVGRWIMVPPTEHLDVRHYGIFPSNTQSCSDSSINLTQAITYANNHGLRVYFGIDYEDSQSEIYYKFGGSTFTCEQGIDFANGVKIIDSSSMTLVTPKINGEPYFMNGNTTLTTNFAKSSWNIKQIYRYNNQGVIDYVIDDTTKSTNINTFDKLYRVIIADDVTDMTFTECKVICKDSSIVSSTFNTCDLNEVVKSIGDSCEIRNCVIKPENFISSVDFSSLVVANTCIVDIKDWHEDVPTWFYLNSKYWNDFDFEGLNVTSLVLSNFHPLMTSRTVTLRNLTCNSLTLPAIGTHTWTLVNFSGKITSTDTAMKLTAIDCKSLQIDMSLNTLTAHNCSLRSAITVNDLELVNCICNNNITAAGIVRVIDCTLTNMTLTTSNSSSFNGIYIDNKLTNSFFNFSEGASGVYCSFVMKGNYANNNGSDPVTWTHRDYNVASGYVYSNNDGDFLPTECRTNTRLTVKQAERMDSSQDIAYARPPVNDITEDNTISFYCDMLPSDGETNWSYYGGFFYTSSTPNKKIFTVNDNENIQIDTNFVIVDRRVQTTETSDNELVDYIEASPLSSQQVDDIEENGYEVDTSSNTIAQGASETLGPSSILETQVVTLMNRMCKTVNNVPVYNRFYQAICLNKLIRYKDESISANGYRLFGKPIIGVTMFEHYYKA